MAEAATPLQAANAPPYSLEAEQAVLGSLMLHPIAYEKVSGVLTEDDFYRADHRLIYRAISQLNEGQRPSADALTVAEWFENHGEAEQVDGGAYLTKLANSVATAANVEAHAQIVRERSVLRQLIDAGTRIAASAYQSEGRDAKTLVEEAEQLIYSVGEESQRRGSGHMSIQAALKQAYQRLEFLYDSDSEITGVPTGFQDLDRRTAGLQQSDLIIVAGRPAMGKTSLAMNLAENAAIGARVPVAIFSMEMSAQQLAFRMFSSLGQIDQNRIRTGNLEDFDWGSLHTATKLLNEAPIFIDETPALSPGQIRSRARRMSREHNIGLIVIDYLQLMQVPDNRENRATEIGEISRGLKAMARELNVPVVALSQLNRSLEQRPNKRPVMADLRESGSIEQDADLILFIYRDEVYNEESPARGLAEIIIGKHRNGATGKIDLRFQGEYLRFQNYAAAYEDEIPE